MTLCLCHSTTVHPSDGDIPRKSGVSLVLAGGAGGHLAELFGTIVSTWCTYCTFYYVPQEVTAVAARAPQIGEIPKSPLENG